MVWTGSKKCLYRSPNQSKIKLTKKKKVQRDNY